MADKKATSAPESKGAQSAAQAQEKEIVIKDAREVQGANAFVGDAPGTIASRPSDGVILEIGALGKPSEAKAGSDPDEGIGEYVVVLAGVLSGVTESYSKGRVVRLSKLIRQYGEEGQNEQNLADATRLFDLKAIRLALKDEAGKGHVEVHNESDELRAERNKRRMLEDELESYRKAASLDANIGQTGPVTQAGQTASTGNVAPPVEGNWQ